VKGLASAVAIPKASVTITSFSQATIGSETPVPISGDDK